MTEVIAKLRTTDILVEDVSFRPLKSRIAMFLLSHIENGNINRANAKPIEIEMTQAELGDCVGASREKVNNHLRAIEKTGAVTLNRGCIRILDVDSLKELAGE